MRLIELVDSDDDRGALLASEKVLERAWGKPKEQQQPERKNPLDEMTPEQRRKRLLELFAYAETLQPPQDARIDEAEPVNVSGATPSAQTHSESTGRRSSLARMAFADWVQTNGFG